MNQPSTIALTLHEQVICSGREYREAAEGAFGAFHMFRAISSLIVTLQMNLLHMNSRQSCQHILVHTHYQEWEDQSNQLHIKKDSNIIQNKSK